MITSNSIARMRSGLIALAIIVPVLYLLIAAFAITRDYWRTLEQAESDARNIAATLNEHAMRTIGEADTHLLNVKAEIERRGLSMPGRDERAIHDILLRQMQRLPQAVTLSAVDAQGWLRASGTAYPIAPIDVRDRPYYLYHAAHDDPGFLLSLPIKGRATDRWAIPLTRRISNPDGSLKMIILLAIDMAYFDQLYRTLKLGEKGRLLLVTTDGRVVMESPLTEQVMKMKVGGSMLIRLFRQSPAGVYRTESSFIDNTARIVGYAGSPEHPLIAVASMSLDYALAPWYHHTLQVGIIGALAIAMLLVLLRFLWKRLEDLAAAQQSLGQQNDALAASKQRYQELVDGIDGIVWEAELPSFRFTYVSGNAGAISGYRAEEWLSNPRFWHEKLSVAPDGQPITPALALEGAANILQPIEHRLVAPDGREIWLRSNIMIDTVKKSLIRLRGVMVDITKQKTSEKQLFQAIHFDPLTKLPNRLALTERMEHALAIAAHSHTSVAILLVDMDHFNTINDSLGHDKGDKVLCLIAQRLQSCLGRTDTLARIGGDEFVILMEEVDSGPIEAEQLACRVNRALGEAIIVGDREVYVATSMGITLFPQDGEDSQTLMRNADTALYRAKAAGRNGWRFFDDSMARSVERRLDIETGLRRALERNEFFLHFQPQRSLDNGRIVGAEALVRWSRPGIGMIPTREFLPLAEESGLIVPMGAWILKAACEQAVAWSREQHLQLRIAVNVAAAQIHQPDFVDGVRRTLDQTGLPSGMLELEITESSIIENVTDTVETLRAVKALGVELAVDDFGTGYSSLSYLKELPIDRLKIDQSFVRDIPGNPDDCAIVRTIIAMARNLNLGVIAEGVESQAQIDFLSKEGCDEIQGFFLSPPVSADALAGRFGRSSVCK
jgi:diguanylate cyclase (GGDEF)-like protein